MGSGLPYGCLFFVDDGSSAVKVFVNTSTRIDVSRLRVGQEAWATGFSGQFNTQSEINSCIRGDVWVE